MQNFLLQCSLFLLVCTNYYVKEITFKRVFLFNKNNTYRVSFFYLMFQTKDIWIQLYLVMSVYLVKTQTYYAQEWLPVWRLKRENNTFLTNSVAQ